MAQKAGGLKDCDASVDLQTVANAVKEDASTRLKKETGDFKAISGKMQVVGGINYFLKVQVKDSHVHLRIYWDRSSYSLVGMQKGKAADDSIEYFERD